MASAELVVKTWREDGKSETIEKALTELESELERHSTED